MIDEGATIGALVAERTEVEDEISRQRLIRVRDRLARHVASATREEGAA